MTDSRILEPVRTEIAKAVTNSGNRKLGGASTTHAAQASCPSDCVFINAGCYAERGPLGHYVLRHLNEAALAQGATALQVAQAEADAIDAMATVVDRPMRLHTVGDCASDRAARIVAEAVARYIDRGGGPCWTYTHAWRTVKRASWGRVSVLASCETEADVAKARRRGYATSLVVENFDQEALYKLNRIKVLPCPAQTREGVTCSSCRLCFNDAGIHERGYSIGFKIHGDNVTKFRARKSLRMRKETQ